MLVPAANPETGSICAAERCGSRAVGSLIPWLASSRRSCQIAPTSWPKRSLSTISEVRGRGFYVGPGPWSPNPGNGNTKEFEKKAEGMTSGTFTTSGKAMSQLTSQTFSVQLDINGYFGGDHSGPLTIKLTYSR